MSAPLTYKNLDWTSTLEHMPKVTATALLSGLGLSLLRRATSPSPQYIPEKIRRVRSRVENVPVRVTPEQAEELRRRGMTVHTKRAQANPSALNAALYGAATLGAGGLGMAFGRYLSRKHDKARSKARITKLRDRIEQLLSDSGPDDQDIGQDARLYSTIKLAAEQNARSPGFFERLGISAAEGLDSVQQAASSAAEWTGGKVDQAKNYVGDVTRAVNTGTAVVGGGLGLLLAHGLYRGARDAARRRHEERARLRAGSFDVMRQRHALAPLVSPTPYVVVGGGPSDEARNRRSDV